jgi:hypothetical protein
MAGRFSPSKWGLLGTSQHCSYGLRVIVECVFRGVDVFVLFWDIVGGILGHNFYLMFLFT